MTERDRHAPQVPAPIDKAAGSSTASTLRALADRVEIDGTSNRLNAEIAVAVRHGPHGVEKVGPDHWIYRNFPNWCVRDDGRVEAQPNGVHWAPRDYTGSYDAAKTLIPDGCGIEMHRYWLKKPGEWWSAALSWGTSGEYAEAVDVPSEARAITASALRARAALAENVQAPMQSSKGTPS